MFDVIMSWYFLPAVVFVLGLITKKFPPKDVNGFYGYRTKMSRKNQATWDFANLYCSNLMIKVGLAELIVAAGVSYFYWNNLYVLYALMWVESTTLVVALITTEIALRKRFDKNGMRKSF